MRVVESSLPAIRGKVIRVKRELDHGKEGRVYLIQNHLPLVLKTLPIFPTGTSFHTIHQISPSLYCAERQHDHMRSDEILAKLEVERMNSGIFPSPRSWWAKLSKEQAKITNERKTPDHVFVVIKERVYGKNLLEMSRG